MIVWPVNKTDFYSSHSKFGGCAEIYDLWCIRSGSSIIGSPVGAPVPEVAKSFFKLWKTNNFNPIRHHGGAQLKKTHSTNKRLVHSTYLCQLHHSTHTLLTQKQKQCLLPHHNHNWLPTGPMDSLEPSCNTANRQNSHNIPSNSSSPALLTPHLPLSIFQINAKQGGLGILNACRLS